MSPDELHLQIRNLRLEDYEQLKALMDAVYKDIGGSWSQFTIEKLIKDFSDALSGSP